MPFPKIHHCIVCETSRPEPFGKSSILGFYGIAPNVEIKLHDTAKPLAKLTFVLLGGISGSGTYSIRFELVGPSGDDPITSLEGQAKVEEDGRRRQLTLEFSGLHLAIGKHEIRLFVDGKSHFTEHFSVERGSSEDFRLPPTTEEAAQK